MSDTHRLFLALDIPEDVRDALAAWQRRYADLPGVRAVAAESLHMTVAFLGERPAAAAEAVAEVLGGVESGPVPGRLVSRPIPVPRRRPRLLALEIESPDAVELQAQLASRLVAAGLLEPERRPFWPHLTVFRLGREGRGRAAIARVGAFPGGRGHAFGFRRIALYRSVLRPEGAHYSRLAANELPQPGPAVEGRGRLKKR